MNTINCFFTTRAAGYDTDQVDRYIQKITAEYENLQGQLAELSGRYDRLLEQPDLKKDAIAKALVDAEIMAIQIVNQAKSEAARILESSQQELQRIQQEKTCVTSEIGNMLNRLRTVIPGNT